MDDKFAKLHLSINNMRLKVIKTKDNPFTERLSDPVKPNNNPSAKKRDKAQEKN